MIRTRVRRPLTILLLVMLPPILGCSEILDSSGEHAESAQVSISATSTVPLRLVTSNRFTAIWNPELDRYDVTLLIADTVEVTSFPIERNVTINEYGIFFVRLINPDPDATATVRMRVRIDGDELYDQAATLRDASIEYLYYTS